jgi:DNA invertase Pin-like site-specific DNA recombinase
MHIYDNRGCVVHAYTRVSSPEQTESGYSLGYQELQLTQYAKLHYPESEFRLWSDPGVSGSISLTDRSAGQNLVAALRAGDVLIVSRLDRIFRNMLDALNQLECFTRRNISFIALDIGEGPIGHIDSAEQLRFHLLSAAAQFERSRTRERILDSIEARRRAGQPLGSNAPFGFRREGKGREAQLVEEPREQAILKLIRNLYQAENCYTTIAREVVRRGHRNRRGRVISASSVQGYLIKLGLVTGPLTKEQKGAHIKAGFNAERGRIIASDPRLVAARRRGTDTVKARRDSRDAAILPIIRKLRAAGITTYSGVVATLNAAGVPSPNRGKKWSHTTISATMIRFGFLTPYRYANPATIVPMIEDIAALGATNYQSIAAALNAGGVPTARGARWHDQTVRKVMRRFGMTLDRSRSVCSPRRKAVLERGRVTQKARRDARDAEMLPLIYQLLAAGITTYSGTAAKLNAEGVPTAKGARWHNTTVHKLIGRLGIDLPLSTTLKIEKT